MSPIQPCEVRQASQRQYFILPMTISGRQQSRHDWNRCLPTMTILVMSSTHLFCRPYPYFVTLHAQDLFEDSCIYSRVSTIGNAPHNVEWVCASHHVWMHACVPSIAVRCIARYDTGDGWHIFLGQFPPRVLNASAALNMRKG